MKQKTGIIVAVAIFVVALVLAGKLTNQGQGTKIEGTQDVVLTVHADNFEAEVTKSDKKVLIDFYADWCGPCQVVSPIIEEIASKNTNVKFVKVNVDENEELSNVYRILYIPTLILMENEEEMDRLVGVVDQKTIEEFVK